MKKLIHAVLTVLAIWAAPAFAQTPPFPTTLPANTVVGRLGVGPGPAQAIPFANFIAGLHIPTATNSQVWAATAGKFIDAAVINTSAAPVTLTDAATIAVNMNTFINAVVTLAGNRTLGNPTNVTAGRSGCIRFIQDGTGSRTITLASNWKTAAAAGLSLTVTAAASDIACYFAWTATFIQISLGNDFK